MGDSSGTPEHHAGRLLATARSYETRSQPALVVLGGRSGEVGPAFAERHALLCGWLPRAEPFVLPAATHLLHVANPAGMAEALAGFFDRHPMSGR
jgi:pimeloyl-ACP methyl ester carboxylesterase